MDPAGDTQHAADTRAVVMAHIDAFNRHSTARLLAQFAPDARWATGADVVQGHAALGELFDGGLWELNPSLAVRTLITEESRAAAELHEELTIDGERRHFPIAVFFEVDGGRIRSAKVFREGSADLG